MRKLYKWLNDRLPIEETYQRYLGRNYLVPKNLNIYYCFGVLAIFVLFNQLISGIWLSMFYTPVSDRAFASVQSIMRDVNYGWLFRYMHTTGASAFFIVLYVHMFRGLLYGSYQRPRELVWILGMFLFLLIISEAIFGYLLPWGQMSYWASQVITSIFGVVPYFGDKLVLLIRGDFVIGNMTLQRFYSLHIIVVPLLLLFFVFLHIVALHYVGSNNPEGIDIDKNNRLPCKSEVKREATKKFVFNGGIGSKLNKSLALVPFYPYYMLKDFFAVLIFLTVFMVIVFFMPDMGGYFIDYNNYIPANRLQSPDDIRPLWYLMPFYGILKAIPNRTFGVAVMLSSILILFFLPWLDKSKVRSMRYKGIYSKLALSCFLLSFLCIGFLAMLTPSCTQQILSRISIVLYFASLLLMPIYTKFEKCVIPVGCDYRTNS